MYASGGVNRVVSRIVGRRCPMAPRAEGAGSFRVVMALLIVGLAAGPAATHLYRMLGGTWGLDGRDIGEH